jgi:uncharacterized membrane protein
MNTSDRLKQIAFTCVFTVLVYITTSISFHTPQLLGVWHMGNLVTFLGDILCRLSVRAFVRAIGAGLLDMCKSLRGSQFIVWAPATLVIQGLMGFLVGKIVGMKNLDPNRSELIARIIGYIEKNVVYFFGCYLFGAVFFIDLLTLFPRNIIEIIFTLKLLLAIRITLGKTYLI